MRPAITLAPLLLIVPTPLLAQDTTPEQPVQSAEDQAASQAAIARLTAAYGGQSLTQLRSVSMVSDRRLAWPGQGQTGGYVEFQEDRIRKQFDFQAKHMSFERWNSINGAIYHNRTVVDATGAHTVDYFENAAESLEETGYWAQANPDYRGSDILLAHFLATEPAAVTNEGTQMLAGQINDVLSFVVSEGTPRAHIYVSRDDGLIRRMVMRGPTRTVTFVFAQHARSDGIAFAREIYAFIDDNLVEFYPDVQLTFNNDLSRMIAHEASLTDATPEYDQSEMTIEELAPGLYHVGQGDYTLFARDGGGLIAVNGDAGLKPRYDALVEHLGETLPLSQVVVSHHHSDHMGGIAAAAELGATVLITQETQRALELADNTPDGLKTRIMQSNDSLGPFRIMVRPTVHATQNAFVLHTASGALWQDDHYHGLMENSATRVHPGARDLHRIITAEGWDVRYLLSGHARKAEEWAVFETAVRGADPGPCPSGRTICADKVS